MVIVNVWQPGSGMNVDAAALDLDLGQVGLVQDLGQLANQGGVDFGVFLVIGHWICALSFVVLSKRDGRQPRSRTLVRAAWTASS